MIMNTKKFLPLLFLLPAMFGSLAIPVFAQPSTPGSGGPSTPGSNVSIKLDNPFKFGNSLYDVIKSVVNDIILPIGGVLCVIAFIYAGFKYVTAGGDKTKITSATNALVNAAIGTALLLGAWTIANVIEATLKQLL